MVHKLQNNAGYFHNKPYKVIFINVHKTIKKKKKIYFGEKQQNTNKSLITYPFLTSFCSVFSPISTYNLFMTFYSGFLIIF
jgi:hypothetical protein